MCYCVQETQILMHHTPTTQEWQQQEESQQ